MSLNINRFGRENASYSSLNYDSAEDKWNLKNELYPTFTSDRQTLKQDSQWHPLAESMASQSLEVQQGNIQDQLSTLFQPISENIFGGSQVPTTPETVQPTALTGAMKPKGPEGFAQRKQEQIADTGILAKTGLRSDTPLSELRNMKDNSETFNLNNQDMIFGMPIEKESFPIGKLLLGVAMSLFGVPPTVSMGINYAMSSTGQKVISDISLGNTIAQRKKGIGDFEKTVKDQGLSFSDVINQINQIKDPKVKTATETVLSDYMATSGPGNVLTEQLPPSQKGKLKPEPMEQLPPSLKGKTAAEIEQQTRSVSTLDRPASGWDPNVDVRQAQRAAASAKAAADRAAAKAEAEAKKQIQLANLQKDRSPEGRRGGRGGAPGSSTGEGGWKG